MNTLNGSLRCGVVSALEERIWLDRREDAGRMLPRRTGGLGRILEGLRDMRTRMQMGPPDDGNGWSGGEAEKRF